MLFLTTGIPKMLRLEKAVGVSTAHDEVVDAFQRYLDTIEPASVSTDDNRNPATGTLLDGRGAGIRVTGGDLDVS